ncbi:ABC transporter permease [Pseudoglutamicibacter albus DNF00011]|uniref:ABC transporter permease n=1 Tax=Pseudoglutamicibacter albus DNF00011 TaxID=1401063 RepID=A0A095YG31_9MICC|nr:ABC transporter permease [Pseudoglutamicibacter albus DNF00011]KGF21461.1 ABC transporter permease [Pseudoglutamicibacter albus DNF00011]
MRSCAVGPELWERIFSFEDYGELLALVWPSIIAGALLAVMGGVVGVMVMTRDMGFAVHGIAELSFAGASIALLLGYDVVTGSMVGSIMAALIMGLLGSGARERNAITGVMMPFGLGLGILALALYQGRSANKFGLLTGQIVAVDDSRLPSIAIGTFIVLALLALMWRPLMFASTDPWVARARGVPVAGLSTAFMIVLGVAVALSIHVVGALLVLALLITPAAAAMRLTASPGKVVVLSVIFAEVSLVGGILLSLAGSLPVSPYITTISFVIWLIARAVGSRTMAWKQ